MKTLLAGLLLMFSASAHAVKLDPYIFYKSFAGAEQVNYDEVRPMASALIEVGVELPKDVRLSYSFYSSIYDRRDYLQVHSLGFSHSFYFRWTDL